MEKKVAAVINLRSVDLVSFPDAHSFPLVETSEHLGTRLLMTIIFGHYRETVCDQPQSDLAFFCPESSQPL